MLKDEALIKEYVNKLKRLSNDSKYKESNY